MQFAKMFLPVMQESGPSGMLPGLAPDPGGTVPLMPLDMTPIPASGQYTGLPFPLSEPLPPPPIPMPMDVATSALPEDGPLGGIPMVQVPYPEPPEFPVVPPSPDAPYPGIEPLSRPLPTTSPFEREAGPPSYEPYPNVSLPVPAEPFGPQEVAYPEFPEVPPANLVKAPDALPVVGASAPALPELGEVPGASLTPLTPGGNLQEITAPEGALPALPAATTAEPVVGALAELPKPSGEGSAAALKQGAETFAEARSRLKAPVPDWAGGKVDWSRIWGDP